ncbi:MAG: hypothetical protein UZ04_CHB001001489 [Chlorobi bacterium OLB4]|nr:MAG: hypothetical protein UZ04_CHB001001489 [Chlorobi bacterium OLB4]MBV6399553.1 hypothetical protein [Ignavibacteria bacterium]RIK47822.1 MAG: hypothetical protein DCC60_09620 [Ignavibacteriota bacterium]
METFITEKITDMDKLKLFRMIESLAATYYARIKDFPNGVSVTFVVRATGEYVCRWEFDTTLFNTELKILFNSNNSVTGERKTKR